MMMTLMMITYMLQGVLDAFAKVDEEVLPRSHQANGINISIISRWNPQYHIAKNRSELALIVLIKMKKM